MSDKRNLITVIMGAQWGDEGKGKLVDIESSKVSGGSNAGHTVVAEGKKLALHLVPCSILNKTAIMMIGNGVVIHLPTLLLEIRSLEKVGIQVLNRMFISDRAHIVFDFHQICDVIGEKGLGEKKIGTTGRGIGPCYMTKIDRKGIRMGSLKNMDKFREEYMTLYRVVKLIFKGR